MGGVSLTAFMFPTLKESIPCMCGDEPTANDMGYFTDAYSRMCGGELNKAD